MRRGAAARRSPRASGAGIRRPPAAGLCRIGEQTEPDRDEVPAVDDGEKQGELHLLFLGEMQLQHFMGRLDLWPSESRRQRLGPAEGGPLALGIARRFPPRRQQIDALLGLAVSRANLVCILMQFAQPLICEARIFTS